MRIQKKKKIAFIIIALCLLTMVGAVFVCSYEIEKNLKKEMQNTLRDVAEQNNILVEKEIDSRFQLLNSVAQEIVNNVTEARLLLDSTKSFVESYKFERIGFIYPTGAVYSSSGFMKKDGFEEFFLSERSHEIIITDFPKEKEDGTSENYGLFSIPVYKNLSKERKGVLFAFYQMNSFETILASQSYEGKGYSCIIKDDGTILAHSKDSPIKEEENFFECMRTDWQKGCMLDTQLQAEIAKDNSGMGSFITDSLQDFYYTPLTFNNNNLEWYMITVVPDKVLTDRMFPILSNVRQMFAMILILFASAVAIFIMFQWIKRKELAHLAYTDTLTEGDNYTCFQRKFRRLKGVHGYLVAMDLSGFKIINNTCGVETGDEVLKETWKMIWRSIEDEELAARIHADRFVIFMIEEQKENVEARLEKMIVETERISVLLNTPRVVPVFGVYETNGQEDLETAYGNAVQAKNLVKGRRDRNYAFYDEVDHASVLERRVMEDGFEFAIEQKQFEVWYQPKYGVMNEEVVGAEALVRWRYTDGSLLPPFKFIPLFEKNGMIPRLDEYVFRSVCEQQKEWMKQGKAIHPVSINISRVSLYYYNIAEKYKSIADECGVDTKYLQLEITESATVDNAEISHLIEKFHKAGFKMLLDDFGSGYSSLSSLNMMHFDTMKLDKSLIDYIGDENGEKLLNYIVKLGQNLGLSITAEGVETREQVDFLKELECDDIQGYFFSKPLPLADFEKLLG